MKKTFAWAIFVLIFLLCFSLSASAADFESAWGKGIDSKEFEARVSLKKTALELCGPDDSGCEKVRKLNKYVCDSAKYDYTYVSKGLSDLFYKGEAICSGYAETLAYLLDCVNVKNFTLTGYINYPDGGKALHIWNVVYIDGKWLHVDPTWNDTSRNSANPSGNYFLLSGLEISKTRKILSLSSDEDYNKYYNFIKTISLSIKAESIYSISENSKALLDSAYSYKPQASSADEDKAENIKRCPVISGRLYAPIREITFALGGYIRQEEDNVSIILGTKTMVINKDGSKGTIDGEEFTFDPAPKIINGEFMVPVRMVLEKLGAAVSYDALKSEVKIFYDPYSANK